MARIKVPTCITDSRNPIQSEQWKKKEFARVNFWSRSNSQGKNCRRIVLLPVPLTRTFIALNDGGKSMSLSHMKWKNSPLQFRDNYIATDVPMSCDIPNRAYLLVSLDFAPSLVVVAGGAPPPNLAKKPTKLDFCSFNICSSRFLSSSKTSSPCSSIHFFIASYPSVACARTTSNGRMTSPGLVVGGMTGGRARNPKRREMKEGPVSAVGVGRSVFESAWGGVSLGRSRGERVVTSLAMASRRANSSGMEMFFLSAAALYSFKTGLISWKFWLARSIINILNTRRWNERRYMARAGDGERYIRGTG